MEECPECHVQTPPYTTCLRQKVTDAFWVPNAGRSTPECLPAGCGALLIRRGSAAQVAAVEIFTESRRVRGKPAGSKVPHQLDTGSMKRRGRGSSVIDRRREECMLWRV